MTLGDRGTRSNQRSVRQVPILPPDRIRTLPFGTGITLLRSAPPIVAEGYTREVNYERNGQAVETEEFVAKKIGHDAARTRYEVDRSPRTATGSKASKTGSCKPTTPTPYR